MWDRIPSTPTAEKLDWLCVFYFRLLEERERGEKEEAEGLEEYNVKRRVLVLD